MRRSVSIVVPTYNRRERLERLLNRLDDTRNGTIDLEVVVVVDGATDGTEAMLGALTPSYALRVVVQSNRGPAAARNAAIAVAQGDVLLFLDDDVVPVPGLVERHLQVHERDPHAVVI